MTKTPPIKYERHTEIFDTGMRIHLEKYYKKSFREGWAIVDVVRLNNSDKWLIKWALRDI